MPINTLSFSHILPFYTTTFDFELKPFKLKKLLKNKFSFPYHLSFIFYLQLSICLKETNSYNVSSVWNKSDPHSLTLLQGSWVLGTNSVDQLFALLLINYACTQQKNPFKMRDQGKSVNQINVNDVKGNDGYYTHCQSKIIEHPIFWHFVAQCQEI